MPNSYLLTLAAMRLNVCCWHLLTVPATIAGVSIGGGRPTIVKPYAARGKMTQNRHGIVIEQWRPNDH